MDNIVKCPHCGGTSYYVKQYIRGYGYFYNDTTGEAMDNSSLHDGLTYRNVGKYAYCADCDKRFAKIEDLPEGRGARMIIDYIPAKECKNNKVWYTCYKCGQCGRKFENGMMIDAGGTTIAEEDE